MAVMFRPPREPPVRGDVAVRKLGPDGITPSGWTTAGHGLDRFCYRIVTGDEVGWEPEDFVIRAGPQDAAASSTSAAPVPAWTDGPVMVGPPLAAWALDEP